MKTTESMTKTTTTTTANTNSIELTVKIGRFPKMRRADEKRKQEQFCNEENYSDFARYLHRKHILKCGNKLFTPLCKVHKHGQNCQSILKKRSLQKTWREFWHFAILQTSRQNGKPCRLEDQRSLQIRSSVWDASVDCKMADDNIRRLNEVAERWRRDSLWTEGSHVRN